MKQEDKKLLLKDLCGRLPYGVICTDNRHGNSRVFRVDINPSYSISKEEYAEVYYWDFDEWGFIENCKPYLRPMSSMTEEEFDNLKVYSELDYDQLEMPEWDNGYKTLEFWLEEVPSCVVILVFDWLNAHHFDYRGLIERGLALEAPDEMYKTE